MIERLLTPKQVARAIGVSESSLKRWCDLGLLPVSRTAGGHRRLPVAGVIEFLRRQNYTLEHPEILGLPATVGGSDRCLDRSADRLLDALLRGEETTARQVVFDLYLAGFSVAQIADGTIAAALHAIGDQWSCGDAEIYQERRACEIVGRTLTELAAAIPEPDGPVALGAAVEGDQYRLPGLLANLVVRSTGWRSTWLGNGLPLDTLQLAAEQHSPRLFWLSVSHVADTSHFNERYAQFADSLGPDTALVVGGQALDEPTRRQMRYAAFCDNMQHLESFAGTLLAARVPAQ